MLCRQVRRGRCAAPFLGKTVNLNQYVALQKELQQLRTEFEHQGRLLAAAREAAERLRSAAASSDRAGSMSSEAPSDAHSTPPSRPAAAELEPRQRQGYRECSPSVGNADPGAEEHVPLSAAGLAQDPPAATDSKQEPESAPTPQQHAPSRAAEPTADGCRELWQGSQEASCKSREGATVQVPPRARGARRAAGVTRAVGPADRPPAPAAVQRFRDVLGRAACAVAAAALPRRLAQGATPAAALQRGGAERRSSWEHGAVGAASAAAPSGEPALTSARLSPQRVGAAQQAATAPGPAHREAAAPPSAACPRCGAEQQRAELLGLQLRAAAAELWALPAVETRTRAATALAEWVSRGELALVLQRARSAEVAAAPRRSLSVGRLGADGIRRLQDRDGRWLSKSQFRKKYKGNHVWDRVYRRCLRAQQAAAAPRQRSKTAYHAFSITPIAACVAKYARNKWARVCRGAAMGWIVMADYRRDVWWMTADHLNVQRKGWDDVPNGAMAGPYAVMRTLLERFRRTLFNVPTRCIEARNDLIRWVEAWQCIFEWYRIQFGDLFRFADQQWFRMTYSCCRLMQILDVDDAFPP
eukprot:TRINITY_DN3918_c0_g1_i4.p2 TRINITY_DN3918_c0_g1~~TRINITY_DN3918_c0_g1_i4.p2  ORF type:complete len:586 (+),score=139.36 TRINITY_DN3918_c0_g1_i4:89-1846(+)